MNTIHDEWERYSKAILENDVSKIQYTETKRAFYAGVQALLSIVNRIGDEETEVTLSIVHGISKEVHDYFTKIVPHEYDELT